MWQLQIDYREQAWALYKDIDRSRYYLTRIDWITEDNELLGTKRTWTRDRNNAISFISEIEAKVFYETSFADEPIDVVRLK